jgi:hypothetical protein
VGKGSTSKVQAGQRSIYQEEKPDCAATTRAAAEGSRTMTREYNVLALIKGTEKYVYLYQDSQHDALMNILEGHATNPLLSLNWFDAAVLKQRSLQQITTNAEEGFQRQIRPTEAS